MSALEDNDQPRRVLSGFMSYDAVRSTHGWLWYTDGTGQDTGHPPTTSSGGESRQQHMMPRRAPMAAASKLIIDCTPCNAHAEQPLDLAVTAAHTRADSPTSTIEDSNLDRRQDSHSFKTAHHNADIKIDLSRPLCDFDLIAAVCTCGPDKSRAGHGQIRFAGSCSRDTSLRPFLRLEQEQRPVLPRSSLSQVSLFDPHVINSSSALCQATIKERNQNHPA